MENLRGIALMIAAMAGFAIADAILKFASASIPIAQILLVVGILGGLTFGVVATFQGEKIMSRNFFALPVVIRNLSEIVGTIGFVTALSLIPLSTASAILQASPLFITLGAALFLKEPIGWRRWSAITVGFIGVMIIIRPGMESFDVASLWAVVGVLALSLRDLATRPIRREIGALTLAAYGFMMLLPASGILFLFGQTPVALSPYQLSLIFAIFTFAAVSYLAITTAMRTGDIGAVTPFRYTRLIFAIAIGMIFFAERPDALTLLGATLVICSGLYTYVRERRISKTQTTLSTLAKAQ